MLGVQLIPHKAMHPDPQERKKKILSPRFQAWDGAQAKAEGLPYFETAANKHDSVDAVVRYAVFFGLVFQYLAYIGHCPHPVTVYIRGPITGYI